MVAEYFQRLAVFLSCSWKVLYCFLREPLNTAFHETSAGCRNGVQPPGIGTWSMSRDAISPLTCSSWDHMNIIIYLNLVNDDFSCPQLENQFYSQKKRLGTSSSITQFYHSQGGVSSHYLWCIRFCSPTRLVLEEQGWKLVRWQLITIVSIGIFKWTFDKSCFNWKICTVPEEWVCSRCLDASSLKGLHANYFGGLRYLPHYMQQRKPQQCGQ